MKKMKKVALLAALVVALAPSASFAEEGGLEISGAIDTLFGWQHDDSNVTGDSSCAGGAGSQACNSAADAGAGTGQLGDLRGIATANRDTFNFYVDTVEVDLSKTFGENIRIRADLDFQGPGTGGAASAGAFALEQGYVTANIPVGNGLELLVGRFNIPMGVESVDRQDNIAVSFSNIYRFLRPHNVTGAKLYYAFNDMIDLHVYAVNNLKDTISSAAGTESAYPGAGLRLGFNWGEEGQESSIGLSGAGSSEVATHNMHFSFMGDLDVTWAINDSFTLAGEFMYRQDNRFPADGFAGTKNHKAMAGTLLAAYNFSDAWGGYVRGGWLHDINPPAVYTGTDQQIIDWSAGFSYQIADSAKLKIEYRGDWSLFAGAASNSLVHGAAAEFAYHF